VTVCSWLYVVRMQHCIFVTCSFNSYSLIMAKEGPKHVANNCRQLRVITRYSVFVGLVSKMSGVLATWLIVMWILFYFTYVTISDCAWLELPVQTLRCWKGGGGYVGGETYVILKFVVVLSDWIPFLWQKAALRVTVMTSGNYFANNYRGTPRLSYRVGGGGHRLSTPL
jgi:hypothetical protein